jgi:hypothetical protein
MYNELQSHFHTSPLISKILHFTGIPSVLTLKCLPITEKLIKTKNLKFGRYQNLKYRYRRYFRYRYIF